jgi:hypothetical protein
MMWLLELSMLSAAFKYECRVVYKPATLKGMSQSLLADFRFLAVFSMTFILMV